MIHEGAVAAEYSLFVNVPPVVEGPALCKLGKCCNVDGVNRLGLIAGCIVLASLGRYAGVLI